MSENPINSGFLNREASRGAFILKDYGLGELPIRVGANELENFVAICCGFRLW